MFFLNSIIINKESLIVIVGSEAYITTAENTTKNNSSTYTKVPCDICGLLFDSPDIKEEHKKLEHVEHKRPSGVG